MARKAEFDSEIENEAFEGRPTLIVDLPVEEGETIVAIGEGAGTLTGGGPIRFAFCTVFTFRGDLIGQVQSYVVPLTASN